VQVGTRPYFLIDDMEPSALKHRLQSCAGKPIKKSQFSIGHRGAALQFPEHSKESYQTAARTGAGIIECDVTFTKDRELVCRHSQCDLHTTTNSLDIPELAAKCTTRADYTSETPFANVMYCTGDITLSASKTLKAKMDAGSPDARTLDEYLNSTPSFRTHL
jgi:glycerophosphoryl diester phosphodiesterase